MQKISYSAPSLGFILNGIEGNWKGTVCAWYDEKGELIGAEQHPTYKTERPIKKDGCMWNRLKQLGKVWKDSF